MEEAVTLSEQDITFVLELAGGHPYLTQQMLNSIFNNLKHKATNSLDILIRKLVRQHDRDFSAWWNLNGKSDGFSNVERTVYRQLVKCREGTSENLAENIDLSPGKVRDSLEVISGTGIVQQVDFERYRIGAKLFETWVAQQELDIREVNPSG